MSDEQLTDDQSHYEISLTAGQAFVAFVLLLLSLAASFAFGLMIGRGQSEDRLVVKKEPAVINETSVTGAKRNDGKIVELGVEDFKKPAATDTTTTTDTTATTNTAAPPPATVTVTETAPPPTPVLAQVLVSNDQKTAEALAATLIEKGFNTAYVERAGTLFKVRIKFDSEAAAKAAEPKLREYAKDLWIVK